MYLGSLLILSLVAFSEQHCHHHSHRRKKIQHLADYHSKVFREVARDVIALDRQSQELCELNSNSAKELLGKNRYVLKIALKDFSENDIKVQVKYRVVYIKAYKTEPLKHYSEVKELPSFVDVRQAKFTFEDGILEVVFPTKKIINNSCNPDICDDVLTVPKFEVFHGDVVPRFGE